MPVARIKHKGGQRLDLPLAAIQAFADKRHTKADTAKAFNVSGATLVRRGIKFSGKKRPSYVKLQMAHELVEGNVSLAEVAARLKIAKSTLTNQGVVSRHAPGWPSVDRKRLVIFTRLMKKENMTQRRAEKIVGVSRLTWRKYKKRLAEARV